MRTHTCRTHKSNRSISHRPVYMLWWLLFPGLLALPPHPIPHRKEIQVRGVLRESNYLIITVMIHITVLRKIQVRRPSGSSNSK